MHPRVMAQRRAAAEARLTESMEALAKRQGVQVPDRPSHRDIRVRDLIRLEQVAEVLAQVAKVPGHSPGAEQSPGLRERLLELRGIDDENIDTVMEEVKREGADRPLHERLRDIAGIGGRTADAIVAEIE